MKKSKMIDGLSWALADVAKVQAHTPKVAACLKMAHDPFPKDESHVRLPYA